MKKVMIVDDEFTIRELVEMTLDSDYEVIAKDWWKYAWFDNPWYNDATDGRVWGL